MNVYARLLGIEDMFIFQIFSFWLGQRRSEAKSVKILMFGLSSVISDCFCFVSWAMDNFFADVILWPHLSRPFWRDSFTENLFDCIDWLFIHVQPQSPLGKKGLVIDQYQFSSAKAQNPNSASKNSSSQKGQPLQHRIFIYPWTTPKHWISRNQDLVCFFWYRKTPETKNGKQT